MSGGGHGHGGHGEHGGHGGHDSHGGGSFEFKDLNFIHSLSKVYTKNGLKDWLINCAELIWDTGVGAVTDVKDFLGELFGAGGGGGSHGHSDSHAHAH